MHHLHFTADDYASLGYLIKCNPAIKAPANKSALWEALIDGRLDLIATDHAPHTLEEKKPPYEHAHSGLPLVQHSMSLMLYYWIQGKISIENIADKMSHAVADCFCIKERGYIREGYWADLVIVDPKRNSKVSKENLLYKCAWSPLEGFEFPATITHTFVNGNLVYNNSETEYGKISWDESNRGQRLLFNR